MRSPHVLIGRYLDDLAAGDCSRYFEFLVEKCILDHFNSKTINPEEFAYYCERFRRLAGREARIAA